MAYTLTPTMVEQFIGGKGYFVAKQIKAAEEKVAKEHLNPMRIHWTNSYFEPSFVSAPADRNALTNPCGEISLSASSNVWEPCWLNNTEIRRPVLTIIEDRADEWEGDFELEEIK